jgi:CobQ-like glutamine amidotransferase family enzyme
MSLKDTNNKTVGYLRDETYNYNEITAKTDLSKIDPVGFAIIATGNEGNDEKTGYHYGNQIAYELLGLGYTVLYKKLDKISDLGTNEF